MFQVIRVFTLCVTLSLLTVACGEDGLPTAPSTVTTTIYAPNGVSPTVGTSPGGGNTGSPTSNLLGVLDIDRFCRDRGYTRAFMTKPQVGSGAASDNWSCVGAVATYRVNLDDVCKLEYTAPGQQIYAQASNPNDAYSYSCYRR